MPTIIQTPLVLPLLLSLSSFALPQDLIQRSFPIQGLLPDDTAPTPSEKIAVAHFIVGNTYGYTQSDWAGDIALAQSKGLDGFALNVGVDEWQPARVADAFAAASSFTGFKLFLSFDMTSLPCTQPDDAAILRQYISSYSKHPNQLLIADKPMVSTFSGEKCEFGSPGVNEGWQYALRGENSPPVHFVPAFFVPQNTLPSLPVMDGAFNWNAAWPVGNSDVTFDPDNEWIANLGGRDYMAGGFPLHYGQDSFNKNFILRGDDWELCKRWELLVENRHRVSFAQVITWNDYGESHYVGPIEGTQPNSQAWTDGFDHQGWLDLIHYYILAFKTGVYPPISVDRLFLWARLYPASATAANDAVGKPEHADYTKDYLWAVAFLTTPAYVTLSCGVTRQTALLGMGVSKIQLPLVSSCSVEASVDRGGVNVIDFKPLGFNFQTNPIVYNFNAFVAASPSGALE
ncbi:glycoside hydrolase family 71 protein [Leucogyrophana mollusca]|uniref:Glycoside hydrolase family 71 protein n=1 Tax=Leucogyrophana mollusca TaxID=85980 RepID=A0ACB8BDH4_9AGAM|nr:glycoside hydrolase family 71 protein [Leucogyrophana mollusca]